MRCTGTGYFVLRSGSRPFHFFSYTPHKRNNSRQVSASCVRNKFSSKSYSAKFSVLNRVFSHLTSYHAGQSFMPGNRRWSTYITFLYSHRFPFVSNTDAGAARSDSGRRRPQRSPVADNTLAAHHAVLVRTGGLGSPPCVLTRCCFLL